MNTGKIQGKFRQMQGKYRTMQKKCKGNAFLLNLKDSLVENILLLDRVAPFIADPPPLKFHQ